MSDGGKLKPYCSSSTFQAMQRRDPIDWIESQVREHGLLRVLWAPVLVVAVVSSLSAWFAGNPLAGLFVAVSLVAIWAVVLLVVSLTQAQRIRNDFDQLKWSLSTLRQYVVDQLPATPRSVLWRDEIDVERNGDMHARTEFRILVEGDRALHFLEFGQVGEPLSRAEQRQVVFTVRQDPGGARVPVDVEWESDTSARFWVHFSTPIQPGTEFGIAYEFTWPHSLPKLGLRGVETAIWTCERPTDRLEYVIRLDASHKRSTPLRFSLDGAPQDSLTQKPEGGGWRIEGVAEHLNQGHVVSLTLDAG